MTSEKNPKLTNQYSDNIDEVSNGYSAISTLNDDCLRHIFSFLSVTDRIRIQRVCKRWKALGMLPWYDFKTLEVSDELFPDGDKTENPIQLLQQILSLCGSCLTCVRPIVIDSSSIESTPLIKLITDTCPNIRSLDLSSIFLTRAGIKMLIDKYTTLTNIDVGLLLTREYEEMITEFFGNNKRLREVSIRGDTFTGSCLLGLNRETIKSLTIDNAHDISIDHLFTAIKRLNHLQVLELNSEFSSIVMEKIDEILQHIPVKDNLIELRLIYLSCIRVPMSINRIVDFPNLKNLILSGRLLINNNILPVIAKCWKSLRQLRLYGGEDVTDGALHALIKELKLEEFYIVGLDQITDKGLSYVPDTLRKLRCENCCKLTNKCFTSILHTTKNLSRLEVIGCKLDVNILIYDAIKAKKLFSNNRLEIQLDSTKKSIIDISPCLRVIFNE